MAKELFPGPAVDAEAAGRADRVVPGFDQHASALVVDAQATPTTGTAERETALALRLWADKLMATKPFKLVALALANKLARIADAVMTTGTSYRNATAKKSNAEVTTKRRNLG